MIEYSARLVAATIAGGAIGLNRDLHGKPTGVRTMGLVGLGSALIVVAALLVGGNGDATRGVKGMSDDRIHGLTTAASIWLTSALGITIGLGHWLLTLVATTLTLFVLIVGGPLEKAIRHRWPHKPEAAEPAP